MVIKMNRKNDYCIKKVIWMHQRKTCKVNWKEGITARKKKVVREIKGDHVLFVYSIEVYELKEYGFFFCSFIFRCQCTYPFSETKSSRWDSCWSITSCCFRTWNYVGSTSLKKRKRFICLLFSSLSPLLSLFSLMIIWNPLWLYIYIFFCLFFFAFHFLDWTYLFSTRVTLKRKCFLALIFPMYLGFWLESLLKVKKNREVICYLLLIWMVI